MPLVAAAAPGAQQPADCAEWRLNVSVPIPHFHKDTPMDIIRIILAIILPPLGVFLQVGIGAQFWINILLTLLGYIPGIVHAVWIIAKR